MSSAPQFHDRVQESSITTGTGAYTLAGAILGFQSFAIVGDGKSCFYCAQEVDSDGNPSGDWEVGIGTYTAAGTTLSRTTILASSNSNNAVNWAAGTRRIFLTLPASQTTYRSDLTTTFGPLPGATPVTGLSTNLSAATHDLYTCPTGKKAFIVRLDYNNYNPASGAVTVSSWLKTVGGTYHRLAVSNTVNANAVSDTTPQWPFIMEAGQSLAVVTGAAGLNVRYSVIEFDASSPLKSIFVTNPSTGDNTLYTVPAGKVFVNTMSGQLRLGWGAQQSIAFAADGGGARTVFAYAVPSGQAIATLYRTSSNVSVTANQVNSSAINAVTILQAGDFYAFNVSVGDAIQWAWVTGFEFDSSFFI